MMDRHAQHRLPKALVLVLAAGCLLPATTAMAAGDWRPTYDIVMMWVNFVILAAVLVKLLRRPLSSFLKTQRDDVRKTLEALESEKGRIEEEIRSLQQMLKDRQEKAHDMHKRIVSLGEDERHEIITAAKDEAARRLLKARQLMDAHYREACDRLRGELIDSAVARAMEELPKHMTPEVEQILKDRFLRSISEKSD
jgi:F-type H+-transporting ATPase subunit b